ncbi:hypothetical protein GCM10020258_40070 [Sphingomonas yabuuchiae]
METVDASSILFNDQALAVQLPVAPGSPVASQTVATAHGAGWIWDIGLPTRRGIGCVYASAFMSDDEAEGVLAEYCRRISGDSPAPRRLTFRSAYRSRPWTANCLAIGQSAGFMEPLEASAIVMIELALDALLDDFAVDTGLMTIQARRFNALATYRWERIVDFLKLHYVLSRRDEPYWRAHRDPATIPDRLAEMLALWRYRSPSALDLPMQDELFPAASYRYILRGMGFPAPCPHPCRARIGPTCQASFARSTSAAVRWRRACRPTAPISTPCAPNRPPFRETRLMSRHEALNPDDHRDLRIQERRDAALGDARMVCIVVPAEFRALQAEYPILFRLNETRDRFSALAMFGFENGENLYLADGRWDARYRPWRSISSRS